MLTFGVVIGTLVVIGMLYFFNLQISQRWESLEERLLQLVTEAEEQADGVEVHLQQATSTEDVCLCPACWGAGAFLDVVTERVMRCDVCNGSGTLAWERLGLRYEDWWMPE